MKNKIKLMIGILISLALLGIVVADLMINIPPQIEIEKLEDSMQDNCVMVYIKGYSDNYIPCIDYNDFNNAKEFEDKLRVRISHLDELILSEPIVIVNPNLDKFNMIKDLEGKILDKVK